MLIKERQGLIIRHARFVNSFIGFDLSCGLPIYSIDTQKGGVCRPVVEWFRTDRRIA
jgi:hypothetical protein